MPRHADPQLEIRILTAADALWRRGGQKALTMRAVAKAARTNTPAVYRRFKDREDLLRGLLQRTVARIRDYFEQAQTLEAMADAYLNFALTLPNEYQLFYSHSRLLRLKRKGKGPTAIRDFHPNFGFVEQAAAKELGGSPDDYTELALQLWGLLHGIAMLLISQAIAEGHEDELREAGRAGVRMLIANAKGQRRLSHS